MSERPPEDATAALRILAALQLNANKVTLAPDSRLRVLMWLLSCNNQRQRLNTIYTIQENRGKHKQSTSEGRRSNQV